MGRKIIKRRTFLAAVGAVAATAALKACGQGDSSEKNGTKKEKNATAPYVSKGIRRLKMVTTWPKNLPGLGVSAENLARYVTEATQGTLEIKVYAAGELVPAFGAFDAVSSKTADMYHGAEYYWQGKSRAYNFFTTIPFGMTAEEHNSWIYYGGGQKLWDDLAESFNIKPMMAANSGVQAGGWFNSPIKNVADFNGLKIRMGGLGGEVLRRLGATPVSMPGSEIFFALKGGTIDAAEWIGPWADIPLGLYQVSKYYYCPGFHEPGSSLALGVNLDVWHSLTPSQQRIITSVASSENDRTLAEFNHYNAKAITVLRQKHGVQILHFSDDIMRAAKKITLEVLQEVAQKDPLTAKIYQSYKKSMKAALVWGDFSQDNYRRIRRL